MVKIPTSFTFAGGRLVLGGSTGGGGGFRSKTLRVQMALYGMSLLPSAWPLPVLGAASSTTARTTCVSAIIPNRQKRNFPPRFMVLYYTGSRIKHHNQF